MEGLETRDGFLMIFLPLFFSYILKLRRGEGKRIPHPFSLSGGERFE
jgi:hypothetical protein